MGFKDFLKGVMNPPVDDPDDEGENLYDDDPISEVEEAGMPAAQSSQMQSQAPAQHPQVSYGSNLELKVVKPDCFEMAPSIAKYLLEKKTVVLNLEETNKEAARRLLDFLSGVAFAIDGDLKKASNSTFIITPKNVNVSGEQLSDDYGDMGEESPSDLF